jgi:PST family polysaccharide transporter
MSAYFMRFIINNRFGLEGVGIWSAAFNISGVLTNFVLNAMITDYYPRLSAISKDYEKTKKEVNTQLEIALLLACPALIVTILFAPLGIRLLYSGRFDEAIPVLRWSVYGILGRVVCWPLGVIIPAQGKGKLLIAVESFCQATNLALTYYLSICYGLPGTGIAMAINYIVYFFIISFIAKKIAKTSIEPGNIRLITLVLFACVISSCISSSVTNELYCYSLSLLFMAVTVFYVLRRLKSKTGMGAEIFLNKFKSKFKRK